MDHQLPIAGLGCFTWNARPPCFSPSRARPASQHESGLSSKGTSARYLILVAGEPVWPAWGPSSARFVIEAPSGSAPHRGSSAASVAHPALSVSPLA